MPCERAATKRGPYSGAPTRRRGLSSTTLLTLVMLIVLGGLAAWKIAAPSEASGAARLWRHSLEEGLGQGEMEGKPVFVLFTADWCPPCRSLKRDVLGHPDLLAHLEERYVCVKIDLTDRAGPNNLVAQQLEVRSIPAMHVYDADGYRLGVYQGPRRVWDLITWLKECRARM